MRWDSWSAPKRDTGSPSKLDAMSAEDVAPEMDMMEEPKPVFEFRTPKAGQMTLPKIDFTVTTNLDEVVKVEYFANGTFSLGESKNRGNHFKVTYEIMHPGNRTFHARGFNASGKKIAEDEIEVPVTDETGNLPGKCQAGSGANNPAQCLLNHHMAGNIRLYPKQVSGVQDNADALQNIKDAAAGKKVHTSCYGNAPCTKTDLHDGMLKAMVKIREKHQVSYRVTSIAGGSHSANSYHYQGRAVDFDRINGVKINGDSQAARTIMQRCRDLGASNVLGPSNNAAHQSHVHCRW